MMHMIMDALASSFVIKCGTVAQLVTRPNVPTFGQPDRSGGYGRGAHLLLHVLRIHSSKR